MVRIIFFMLLIFGGSNVYAAAKVAPPAHYPKIEVMEKYITEEAPKYGIDPKIAVKVAQAEGLNKAGEHIGFMTKDAGARYSFGPFQLRIDGFGNKFDFGKAPTNLNWKAQIDYALNIAKNHGWGGWAGAAAVGISDHCGIANGKCEQPWETAIHEDYKVLQKVGPPKPLDKAPPDSSQPKPLDKAPSAVTHVPLVIPPNLTE